MRISRLLGTVAAGALLLGAPAAFAADAPFKVTGNVTFTTDYVFRGVSQTLQDPAVQGGLTVSLPNGFFVGLWGSNVDFGPTNESVEIDYSAGYTNTVGNLSYTAGVYVYSYPGAESKLNYDYVEAGLNLGYTMGIVTPTVSVYYSPEFFGETGAAWYVTGGVSAAPNDIFKIYANVGLQTVDKVAKDVTDWNIGASATFYGLTFDVKYTDTNAGKTLGKVAESRIVASVGASF